MHSVFYHRLQTDMNIRRIHSAVTVLTAAIAAAMFFVVTPSATAQCWDPARSYVRAIYPSSGNREIDQLVSKEAMSFGKTINVVCNIFYVDDGSSYNAFASQNVTDNMVQDGSVYLGEHLLRDKLWKLTSAKLAIIAVLAHEYAHVWQYKAGYGLSGRQQELHADFLAGYYLGKKGYVSLSELKNFADTLYYSIVSMGFFDTESHGSVEERGAAMIGGFKMRHENIGAAYSKGLLSILKEDTQSLMGDDQGSRESMNKKNSGPLYGFCTGLKSIVENAPFHFKSFTENQQPETSLDTKFWKLPFYVAHTTDAHLLSRAQEPDVPRTCMLTIRRSSDHDDVSDAYNAISTGVRNCLHDFNFDPEIIDSSQTPFIRQSTIGYDRDNGVKVSVVLVATTGEATKETPIYECDIFIEEYLK
jgi:hypothetical protein